MYKRLLGFFLPMSGLLLTGSPLWAQDTAPTGGETHIALNGVFWLLMITIVLLFLVILVLAELLKSIAKSNLSKLISRNKSTAAAILALVTISSAAFAQEAAPAAEAAAATVSAGVFGIDATLFYSMMTVIVIEFLVVLSMLIQVYRMLRMLEYIKPMDSILPRWMRYKDLMGTTKPVEQEEAEIMLDHDYDGIKELDNGMPPILQYIFIGTIAMAAIYYFYYQIGGYGPTQLMEYEKEMADAEMAKQEYLKKAGNAVDENSIVYITDAASLAKGESIFKTSCASCHGNAGEGGVGPNLTDEFWLHGGSAKDMFKTVKYGVPEKGMPTWQASIRPADMQSLVSYIHTLHGTKPANAKAPQGEIYKEDAAPAATDSTAVTAQATSPADSTAAKH
jgi:cytochrome c oxidase cbb3-type subunit 3